MASQREKRESHPGDVEQLDFALHGAHDEAGRAVARHVDACAACRDDVEAIRLAHRVLSEYPPVPDRVAERARSATEAEWADPVFAAGGDGWIVAEPIPAMAGYRVARTDELHLNCTVGDRHLDVLLHPGRRDRVFAISGQILRSDGAPAPGDVVVLMIDHEPADQTRTNGYGEFEFDERSGAHLGLRLGDDATAPRIEVWTESRSQ